MFRFASAIAVIASAVLAASASSALAAPHRALPQFSHVVIVMEENKSFDQIIGSAAAPYINTLARRGALFTNSHGVTHPSLPNYFALFAGAVNTNADGCPATGISTNAVNLASELIAAKKTFGGYSESLPERGFTGCWAGDYGRKHAPWVHFTNVPGANNLPFTAFPAYDRLPTVSFIVPNVQNDMHDGSIAQGDAWLRTHLGPLIDWGQNHDTLVVLTWDEDFGTAGNRIPTLFLGPMVRPGRYDESVDHYRVLRTVEDLFALPHAGNSATVQPIADCWSA